MTVGIDNGSANLYDSFLVGCTVYEHLATQFTPLDLTGFTGLMASNDNLRKTIKEIQLLYMDEQYITPEKRLLFTVLSASLAIHNQNKSSRPWPGRGLDAPVSTTTQEKYAEM